MYYYIILLILLVVIGICLYKLRHPIIGMITGGMEEGSFDKEPSISTVLKDRTIDNRMTDDYYNFLIQDIKKSYNPIITLDDIPRRLTYIDNCQYIKPQVHIGQRKLFLSELQFLSKNTTIKYCIYAGSAPGHKTHYLSSLFPHIKFILIDPNRFDIKLDDLSSHRRKVHPDIIHMYYGYKTDSNKYKMNKKCSEMNVSEKKTYINFIKKSNHKLFVIEDYMADNYANMFKELQHVFISDIRSNESNNNYPTDFDIYWNSSMMFNWISILQPENSMLKFRPLYLQKIEYKETDEFITSLKFGIDFKEDIRKKIFHMPKSTLYVQAWAGKSSSELRMWIKKEDIFKIVEYNCDEIGDKMFYFNTINRGLCYHKNENVSRSLHFCNCNDCALENAIWSEYTDESPYKYIKKLDKITFRPLSKLHNNVLYEKLNYKTLLKFFNKCELERLDRSKKNIGKKYVKHKGDTGKEDRTFTK